MVEQPSHVLVTSYKGSPSPPPLSRGPHHTPPTHDDVLLRFVRAPTSRPNSFQPYRFQAVVRLVDVDRVLALGACPLVAPTPFHPLGSCPPPPALHHHLLQQHVQALPVHTVANVHWQWYGPFFA